MNQRSFFLQLGLLSAGLVLILLLVHQSTVLQPYLGFSMIMVAFFIVFSMVMYVFGIKAAKSENKHNFTNIIIGFIFGKLLFCGIIIIFYNQIVQPTSKNFLLPFLLIYITYTIFEAYFLSKIGRIKK